MKKWMKQTCRLKRVLAALLALMMCLPLLTSALAAGDTAATMQLIKTEGSVSVTKSSGRPVALLKNLQLYNGYHVKTQARSYAWINLDNTKVSKLDTSSEVELRKSGRKLELLLKSGNLFFNVAKPLDNNESLNIHTGTLVLSIRGTCGWTNAIDPNRTRIHLLHGSLECKVFDPASEQSKSITLKAGETADFVVYRPDRVDRAEGKCDVSVQSFTRDDVPGFILAELAGNEVQCQEIYDGSGIDLRDVTPEEARKRQEEEENNKGEKLKDIENQRKEQENTCLKKPVWIMPAVTGVSVTPSTTKLYLASDDGADRSSKTLQAVETLSDGTTRPANGVIWSVGAVSGVKSASDSVLALDCGDDGSATVRAVGEGTAAVTATVGNYSATCTVTVEAMYMTPGMHTVTFDANGGTLAGASTEKVAPGGTAASLPTATRDGFNFAGWNTSADGTGTEFTKSTPVTSNMTVYAQWIEIPAGAV